MSDLPSEQFLSEAWFSWLEQRLVSSGPLPAAPEGLRVGQVVTDAPGSVNELCWTLVLEPESPPALLRGSVETAEVTLVATFVTARSLYAGESAAAQLLADGSLKIRGDARRLLGRADLVAAVGAGLGSPSS